MRPRALDLFCGAGGAAMGLHRAGFDVVGIDIVSQPRYPFAFIKGDALRPPVRLEDFDLVWASPPCQAFSSIAAHARRRCPGTAYDHPDLVDQTRAMLQGSRHYVIENVVGAPLRHPFMLCGSQFAIDVKRHRIFEASFFVPTLPCRHANHAPRFQSLDKRQGKKLARFVGVHGQGNYKGERAIRERAMGVDWMSMRELTQAIPPAYSEHIGNYALMALGRVGETTPTKERS